jgi:hypothetical protein
MDEVLAVSVASAADLAGVPAEAQAQWREIADGFGYVSQMQSQVIRRALLPRAISLGQALAKLKKEHYREVGATKEFVAHATALVGLKASQLSLYERLAEHHPLLLAYLERHQLQPPSMAKVAAYLSAARRESRRLRHGGPVDQWVDGRLVGADAPKQIAAEGDAGPGGQRGRHKEIQALKDAAANLWQWSSDEAVGSRPGLRERVEKVAQAVEVVLQQIQAAINPEAGIPGAESTQLDLVEEAVACPMSVVITPEPQVELAELNLPATNGVELVDVDPVPAVGTTSRRKRNPIGVVTKRADKPSDAYPISAEGLALLEADIDRAGGQPALGAIYGVAKQSIQGLLQSRKKQVAKLQAKAEVAA